MLDDDELNGPKAAAAAASPYTLTLSPFISPVNNNQQRRRITVYSEACPSIVIVIENTFTLYSYICADLLQNECYIGACPSTTSGTRAQAIAQA